MNTDLMLDVANAIELYPDNFKMSNWWDGVDGVTGTPAECGTTACIAGWAITLNGIRGHFLDIDFDEEGKKALDLTWSQSGRMFVDWIGRCHTEIVSDLRAIAKGDLVWSDQTHDFEAVDNR